MAQLELTKLLKYIVVSTKMGLKAVYLQDQGR